MALMKDGHRVVGVEPRPLHAKGDHKEYPKWVRAADGTDQIADDQEHERRLMQPIVSNPPATTAGVHEQAQPTTQDSGSTSHELHSGSGGHDAGNDI